ncbi:MAG TPA: DUF1697 domain-containing protein [Steroidobacteraceae bacterium]|nr:DUF1697 domain-containing protein [Steroidobacteraceae bacterium]
MARFVAFLRGVSPMNCKTPDLKRSIETAGFTDVRTILASGNVAFDARASAQSTLERKAEAAMKDVLGRSFYTIVRSQAQLIEMLEADPFAKFKIPAKAKRVVTFLRERPTTKIKLPYRFEGVHIVALEDREIFTAYEPHPRGPIFMTLLERNFGKDITTRTWDTIKKCSAS